MTKDCLVLNCAWWRHPLVWICTMALALRLITLMLPVPVDYDTMFYRETASNLLAGKGYSYNGKTPELYWMPVATGLHVLAQLVSPSPMAARVLWVLIGVVTVGVGFGLAQQYFGRRVAIVFGAIMAVYPYNLVWGMYATTEIPNLLLLMGTLWLIVREAHAVLIGMCFGVACLCRAPDLAFLPLILSWSVWPRKFAGVRAKRLVWVLCGFLICTVPWSVRVSLHAKTFVPLSAGGLRNVWLGTNPWYPAWMRGDMDPVEYGAKVYSVCDPKTTPYAEQNRRFGKALFQFAVTEPGKFVGVLAYKTVRFFVVPPSWSSTHKGSVLQSRLGGHGRELAWAVGLTYLLVVGGATGAIVLAVRRGRWREIAPMVVWIFFGFAANVWFDAVVAFRYKCGAETCMLLLSAWLIASARVIAVGKPGFAQASVKSVAS